MDESLFGLSSNAWIAILTFVLACLAIIQAGIYVSIHHTTKRTERAYLAISHHPPGLIFSRFTGGVLMGIVYVAAQNKGNTPADVTDFMLNLALLAPGALPPSPEYQIDINRERVGAFLVKDDLVTVGVTRVLSEEEFENIRSGTLILYAIAYADYVDVFGKRRRAGYARCYSPERDDFHGRTPGQSNNMPFTGGSAYNYDRERVLGEGRDWI
jgi:hypothetical protein